MSLSRKILLQNIKQISPPTFTDSIESIHSPAATHLLFHAHIDRFRRHGEAPPFISTRPPFPSIPHSHNMSFGIWILFSLPYITFVQQYSLGKAFSVLLLFCLQTAHSNSSPSLHSASLKQSLDSSYNGTKHMCLRKLFKSTEWNHKTLRRNSTWRRK